MTLLLEIGAVGAWFVIVITGKMPRGLFDPMVLANSYIARSDAYIYMLTETYPPFQDEQTRSAGVAVS
jgi:dTDP-4-dehydrorhamnose 3,5-epimerase-like enzyme